MKRFLINSILAIIFSICVVLSTVILVLFNDNFVLKEFDKYDYYKVIEKNIEKRLPDNCYVSSTALKEDLQVYIKSFYNEDKLNNAIKCNSDINLDKLYLEEVAFNKFKLYKYYYGIFFSVILVIFIVGSIFLKTKKIHDIDIIFIVSFFILTLVYGAIYLFVDFNNDILNQIINSANHYLLGFSIIILEIGLIKKFKIRINNS